MDTGNPRYEHWKKISPNAKTYQYMLWVQQQVRDLVNAQRWDVVTVLGGGSVIDHDAFTEYLLEQTEGSKDE